MDVMVTEGRGCLVVSVKGRLDTLTAFEFDERMGGLDQVEGRGVILDLAGLEYLSSAGIRSLLALSKKVEDARGRVAVCGLDGLPKEVFLLTRLDALFPLFDGVGDALQNLCQGDGADSGVP